MLEKPVIGKNVFIAQGAAVRGKVVLEDDANIWFNAVIRAESGSAVIGKGSNVQDNCTVHVDVGAPVSIGENVTIGHNAVIHGCTIGDNSLIGMGAVVMNHAVIGKNCIVAAGALVTQGTQVPDGSLVMGSPAKVKRPLTEAEIAANLENAQFYVKEAGEYMESEKA